MFSVDGKYSVLVVDPNRTCLFLLETCLKKWNYQVTTAKDAAEALSLLRSKYFDLVMTEVHMPGIDGFQFLSQIVEEFNLPVIVVSADATAEVMAMMHRAQTFWVKPIRVEDVRNVWQLTEYWKAHRNNSTVAISHPPNGHGSDMNAGEGASSATTGAAETSVRTRIFSWTPEFHRRFVEAILAIGYKDAVPSNILETMDVPGLTKRQVSSHLQKYQKFLKRVLDGNTRVEFSDWIDLEYYSSFVHGNPDIILIKQLQKEKRNGRLSTRNPLRPANTVRARNGSSTRGRNRPLPPLSIIAGASSTRSAALPATYSGNMGNIAGCGTPNTIHDVTGRTDQMRIYDENTLPQEQNNYLGNVGLIGGATNDMIPSANIAGPQNNYLSNEGLVEGAINGSVITSENNVGPSQQLMNVGGRGGCNSYHGNDLINADQATQLGNNPGNSSICPSVNASDPSGNASSSAMNSHQGDGEQVTDRSWFNNNNWFDEFQEDTNWFNNNNWFDEFPEDTNRFDNINWLDDITEEPEPKQ